MFKRLICGLRLIGTPCITQFNGKNHDSWVPYPKHTNVEIHSFILTIFLILRKICEGSSQCDCNPANATRRLIVKVYRSYANCTRNIVTLVVQAYCHSKFRSFLLPLWCGAADVSGKQSASVFKTYHNVNVTLDLTFIYFKNNLLLQIYFYIYLCNN